MSYKVLYRKYRPNTFNEIIGQTSIVDNLKNSIKNENFSHAYIFTGPRGTGKTSTAKVFAKAINCLNPKNGDICGQCENCQNFATSPDIIEIDAASNNGVDEIRELRNNITHAPASSKYKVYIIDEVHMLSPGAFNALLKTLEEPPAHAVFILATTEVYKVPITILSRCQRYDFKKIDKKELIDYLKVICNKENIKYEDVALEEIYSLSDGCLRDALSILDQISKSCEEITLNNILKNYNIISTRNIEELLDYIKANDVAKIIEKIEDFENSGMNAQKLLKKIISHLEKLAINTKLKIEKRYDFNNLSKLIKSLNECYVDARINENVFSMIKLSFLELIDENKKAPAKQTLGSTANVVEKSQKELKKVENISTGKEEKNKPKTLFEIRINNCFAEANKTALKNIIDLWNNIDKKKITAINADDYVPVAASEKYVIFTSDESSLVDLFNIKSELIEKFMGKNKCAIKVVAITNELWKKEKQDYIQKIKNGTKYELIEEPCKEDDSKEIKGQIENLFTDKIVEIS